MTRSFCQYRAEGKGFRPHSAFMGELIGDPGPQFPLNARNAFQSEFVDRNE